IGRERLISACRLDSPRWRVMHRLLGVLALLPVLATAPLNARTRRARSQQVQAVQLPATYDIDLQLGLEGRSRMMRGNSLLLGTPLNSVGEEVFTNLVGNSSVSSL